AEDEAARLHAGDLVDLGAGPGMHQLVDCAAERARITQQGRDVTKHDPRLGIVWNAANRGLEVVFEDGACHGRAHERWERNSVTACEVADFGEPWRESQPENSTDGRALAGSEGWAIWRSR